MKFFLLALFSAVLLSCKTTTYYISRHAEKSGAMTTDPPLTARGEQQAKALRDYLKDKKIAAVYSTNYVRTVATARPTADACGLSVTLYNAAESAAFIDLLKASNRNNVLIIGHSNTVDDMVNRLAGTNAVTDLPDGEYGSLFIVRKKGSRYRFEKIAVPVDGLRQP